MNDRVNNNKSGFAHHQLYVYGEARAFLRLVHRQPLGSAELRNQAHRASTSVVLNIAEAASLSGAARKRHFRIARGSLIEALACYGAAEDIGESVQLGPIAEQARIVSAMLTKLLTR